MHTATWMTLGNIILSERNQSQKMTYCMIPFIRNVQSRQVYTDRQKVHQWLPFIERRKEEDVAAGRGGVLFAVMKCPAIK